MTMPVPMLGVSLSMVANLKSLDFLLPLPTRVCRKKKSPSPDSHTLNIKGSKRGETKTKAMPEKNIREQLHTYILPSKYLPVSLWSKPGINSLKISTIGDFSQIA